MKFSIITCTYNSEDYLQKNIDSVESQTFSNFEHIFIDAFSSDKTLEIIKKYQKKYPQKIKLFQSKPKGISNAMNKGIEKAQGEYIIHLHSDDNFYNQDILQIVNKEIKINNYPDLLYGKSKFIDYENNRSRIVPHRKIYQKMHFWLLLLSNYIPHPSVFIKRKLFKQYGSFNEELKNSMDYDLWLRLAKNKVRSVFINKILSNFTLRSDSQSSIGKNEHRMIHKNYTPKIIGTTLALIDFINRKRNILK